MNTNNYIPIDTSAVQNFRQELVNRRALIDELLESIEKLYPNVGHGYSLGPTVAIPIPRVSRRGAEVLADGHREKAKGSEFHPLALKNLQKVGWTLPEEFTSQDVAKLFPKGSSAGSVLLNNWKLKGWIVSPSVYQWRKTATFPKPPDGAHGVTRPTQEAAKPKIRIDVDDGIDRSPAREIHVPRESEQPAPVRVGTISSTDAAAMAVAEKLGGPGEEWKVTRLAELLGDNSPGRAYRWISDWQRRNWIQNSSFGTYRKTTKFGNL